MNRLTEIRIGEDFSKQIYYVRTRSGESFNPYDMFAKMKGATLVNELHTILSKLAAYEETGLEPEETLTAKEMEYINFALNECKKYKDLEDEGRLIKLPCKVGDEVYVLRKDKIIEKGEIICISKHRYATMLNIYFGDRRETTINIDDFGRLVFLTREEAEKVLESKDE